MGKCMIEVNSKEEKEQIEKNHSFSVEMFHSHECPHCKQMKPIVEDKCTEVQKIAPSPDLVAFIDCPVNKEFCKEEAVALGAKGIPFIVGKPRGQKPVFEVEGARPNEFIEQMEKIKQLINKSKQAAGVPLDARPAVASQDTAYTYSPPQAVQAVPDADDGRMQFRYDTQQVRNPNATPLCTPGVTCSQADYNARLATFISRMTAKREFDVKF